MALATSGEMQFYDALIVTTAARSGCKVLFTEDSQHGRTFEGVKLLNPFRLSTDELNEIIG